MSTIEKLFVQIFDRKRQIIDQLNHKKQLYDQHLASKLLIQGITPPPWLLHSTASSSHPKDLNKEELISGLLLPCPQPLLPYSNAAHFHGQPLSTVANSGLQHDLFNATNAGCRISDDCRPGVSPQCLFSVPEDIPHHVAESPQERVISDINADPFESMARMQRSKSRQKALELRSSRKVSVKSQLEDNPPTGPRRQSKLKEGSERASGRILSSSKDESLLEKQDISSKEDGGSRCPKNEADSSTNSLSPHSDCRGLSFEESLVAADSVSNKGGTSRHLFKEPVVGIDGSSHRKCANSEMLTEELMENQSLSCNEEIAGPAEVATNTFEVRRVQEGEGPAEVAITHDLSNEISDQVVNLCAQDISNKEEEDSRCLRNAAGALKNSLSPHSDCRGLSVEESLVAADSVSSKGGTSRHLFKEPVVGIDGSSHRMCENSEMLTEELMENQSLSCNGEIAGPAEVATNTFEVRRVQEGEGPAEVAITHDLSNEISDQVVNLCAQDISNKEEEDSRCLRNAAGALKISLSPHSACRDLPVEESLVVAADSVSGEVGISRNVFKEPVTGIDGSGHRNCANSNLLTEELMENPSSSCKEEIAGPTEVATNSFEVHRVQEGEGPTELATTQGLSNEIAGQVVNLCAQERSCLLEVEQPGQVVNLCAQEHSCHLQVEQPSSVSSDKMKLAIGSTGKKKFRKGERYSGEGELGTNSFDKNKTHIEQSPAEVASTHALSSVEVVNISPEEHIRHLLSEQPAEVAYLGEGEHGTNSSDKSKIESNTSKSASPNLQVNPKNILSHGVYFGQPCASDFSATEITQNDHSSLSTLTEHCSTMLHKEEKLSSQSSSYAKPERLQSSSLSSFSQQLIATSQDSLHKADLSRGDSDFSFSISRVDADPADNKIGYGKTSFEVNNAHDCSGGTPFVEHKEALGVEGDVPYLESFIFDKKWEDSQNIRGTNVYMADKVDTNMADILKSSPTAWCLQKSPQKVKDLDCLGGSPTEHMDVVGKRASVADLESFTFKRKCDDTKDTGDLEGLIAIDLPKNTIDRAKFLERLCRSASLGVPLSHVQASYSSDWKMDICHSVPIGVLEHTDLINTSAVNEIDGQLLTASHTCTKHVENSEFQGNSFYDHSPIPSTQFAWDFRGTYVSPVSKEIEGVSAKSRRSSKGGSSNPELTCFPIEESGEEDVNAEDNDHGCPEETGSLRKSLRSDSEEYTTSVVALDPTSKMVSSGSVSPESSISASDKQRSSNPELTYFPVEESSEQHVNVVVAQTCEEKSRSARQPLRAISKNVAALVVHPSLKRGTESLSIASRTSDRNNKIGLSSQAQSHQSACSKKRKKNQNVSLDTAGVKKLYESRSTRFSKTTVSAKSGLETRGGSFSEKDTKPNNIVSNVTSFVQLVQQKQAAARPPVKKDRVKALEAAEAAKQRAEKQENERKQKKEAQMLEQAKRKQEKLRQLELKKKEEEEERKRKDAEIAVRKRQREENERKERERKRKRVGEARRHQKGHEDKMSVDKEECRSQAEDGRKEVNAGREETAAGGQEVKEVARKSANNPATSSALPVPSGDLYINEDASANVAGCSTPTPDVNYSSTTQTIRDKSYDISPYCCSDGEEDEDDELPNDKIIPAWASKSSVTKALASLSTLDPDVIFPPSSFCSLNEVLLPRQLKQK